MKNMKRGDIAATRWDDVAKQLPVAVTNEGNVVAYLVKGSDDVVDISDFPPLMRQKVLSIVELVNIAR